MICGCEGKNLSLHHEEYYLEMSAKNMTPTWATALLSLIGFILLVLMILAWVAMFGDDCGCCGGHRYGRCCCPGRICGFRSDDEEMIHGYEDESILAAAETLVDSPEHCPHHHKHHCHVDMSDDDEAHS